MFEKARVLYETNKVQSYLFRKVLYGGNGIFSDRVFNTEFDKSKSIFIHIPKVAGRSIAHCLYGNERTGHFYHQDYFNNNKGKVDQYFKFAFVRDPLDRIYSSYSYLINGGGNPRDMYIGKYIKENTKSFDDFVINWLNDKTKYSWIHFVPQVDFIYRIDGQGVDFIGKFENINEDFNLLVEKLGIGSKKLPLRNQNYNKAKINHSRLTESKVKELYKEDYIRFNY
ncbi:sulfotransferase family 2 domain-containing protein [Cobetia amphilecti]|uniref:sulfotransferase family 2 domain-containing protein n=1 Tax=Cobetia amphilecti TaxID=1055104 RepID=UPI0024484A0C|nr:sulfotransferase family 2 domain-containing protein [Cobetia litoralis]MDH2421800.1 sulfotransferase family 2 domain-containing protein [Cobetia litoralis]